MSLVALASVKASPGVTTAAVALASAWPEPRAAVVVEADPDGGSLAARFGLAADPGLVSLAAASRREARDASDAVARHTQALPSGVAVVVAPPSAEQVHSALRAGAGLATTFRQTIRADLLVDCGRLGPDAPSLPLARAADLLVLVTRPRLDEVHHLVHRIAAIRDEVQRVGLLTIGARPYDPEEVASAGRVDLLGTLPDDPRAAETAGAHPATDRRFARSPLAAAARNVAAKVVDGLASSPAPATTTATATATA